MGTYEYQSEEKWEINITLTLLAGTPRNCAKLFAKFLPKNSSIVTAGILKHSVDRYRDNSNNGPRPQYPLFHQNGQKIEMLGQFSKSVCQDDGQNTFLIERLKCNAKIRNWRTSWEFCLPR